VTALRSSVGDVLRPVFARAKYSPRINAVCSTSRPAPAIGANCVSLLRAFPKARRISSPSRAPSAPTQTDSTRQRSSLVRMASADLVQTKGLGLALCSSGEALIAACRSSDLVRRLGARHRHHARRGFRRDRRLAGLAGLVAQQPVDPALGKALLPSPHRRPADADALRHLLRQMPIC
jgi:hypothetical protein